MTAINCCGRKSPPVGKFSALCGFGIERRRCFYNVLHSSATEIGHRKREPEAPGKIIPWCRILLLVARALGLGATLTTLYLQFEKEAEAALGLPPGVHSYALLPIGYPMGRFGPVRRITLPDVVYEDRWGKRHPEPINGRHIAAQHGVTLHQRCVNRLLKLVQQN